MTAYHELFQSSESSSANSASIFSFYFRTCSITFRTTKNKVNPISPTNTKKIALWSKYQQNCTYRTRHTDDDLGDPDPSVQSSNQQIGIQVRVPRICCGELENLVS